MAVVLLTSDLAVVSRVEGAVMRAGETMRTAAHVGRAVEQCIAEPPTLLIVDLSMTALDVESLIQQLRVGADNMPRTVAFGPHVHEQRLAAAREAGCDEVVSRGEFFARLDAILRPRS